MIPEQRKGAGKLASIILIPLISSKNMSGLGSLKTYRGNSNPFKPPAL
jgi:hypothetical protein